MKTHTFEVAHRIAGETDSHTNSALFGALWLVARISEYRKRHAHERTRYLLKRNIGEIPTHLLDDIGIDEYREAKILAKATRNGRIVTFSFLPIKG